MKEIITLTTFEIYGLFALHIFSLVTIVVQNPKITDKLYRVWTILITVCFYCLLFEIKEILEKMIP
jgi:hypothetical protein